MIFLAWALGAIALVLPSTLAQSVTISQMPAFDESRDCIRYCLYNGLGAYGAWGNLPGFLGCDSSSCVCEENLRLTASSWLSSCLYTLHSSCADDIDYRSALQIYDNFCSFTAPAVFTTTQSGPPNTDAFGVVTVTQYTSGPTVTTTSTSSSAPISTPRSIREFFALALTTALVLLALS